MTHPSNKRRDQNAKRIADAQKKRGVSHKEGGGEVRRSPRGSRLDELRKRKASDD